MPLAWAQEILRAKHLGVGGWVHLRLEKRAGIYLPVVGGAGDGIITRGSGGALSFAWGDHTQ